MERQSTLHRGTEVYRFRPVVLIVAPLTALALQFLLPVYFPLTDALELPLLLVIYYALVRHSAIAGIVAGAVMGLARDTMSRDPIGVFALTSTVAGYVTSVLGNRMQTEGSLIRFTIVFVLYYIHYFSHVALNVAVLGQETEFSLSRMFLASLVNASIGVIMFKLLDRFRKPI